MIVNLPKDGNNNSILVIVDSFTKYGIFVECSKKLKALELAELFLDNVWKHHGMPEKTILDKGRVFNNKFLRALYKHLGIDPHFSSAYHPQSNRQTEQVNPSIKHFLRLYSGVNQWDWTKWLPMAEFAYNNAIHSSTSKTPFKALYGLEPTLTLSNVPTDVLEANNLAKTMEAQWLEVEAALQQSKTHMTAREDGSPPEFEIGEEAWLDAKNINLKTLSPKLTEQCLGLFKIIERISNFTVDREEEYKIEGITNMEERNRKWFFRVKWKGYGNKENTWEPWENHKNTGKILKKYGEDMRKKALGTAKALRGGAVL
ncbi:Retrotransposable element Tf2 protein [Rhizoctonia solani]|uniref:Retrotransposable element Tf2 protein n=1 Tax=Rhizoctonia solani TaxID=456999 RepID=A0A8H8P3W3_9AGAM|nr:Retrotransposable element Tf2 protein [Rhizoctonia solani]QRW23147.1 Retrotransposable element Tf2 protein [Rhizoctonia solani]